MNKKSMLFNIIPSYTISMDSSNGSKKHFYDTVGTTSGGKGNKNGNKGKFELQKICKF